MLVKVLSCGVFGIDAYQVEVEVDMSPGLPRVTIVGLPDAAVKESLDRVSTAVSNSRYQYQPQRLTINLAPADVRKEGPAFDLPIALGYLLASEQIRSSALEDYAFVGELALDGAVRQVKGCLPMALACRAAGIRGFVVPQANAAEAAVVEGLDVIPTASLRDAVGFVTGQDRRTPLRVDLDALFQRVARYDVDFADVRGQEHVKRALTVSAAGGHNVLLIGPPGSGKTMLAKRTPTILPPLTLDEALETTKIYSIMGLLPSDRPLIATRPFRSPHHTVSDAGLIGGGAPPKPGEVSLAHNGVLFLDELPEFNRRTLEVLRQPLEDGKVTIARAQSTITYPSSIILIAACNPCPCGYRGDPRRQCRCSPAQVQHYMSKISGPLLDRIDIHIEAPAVDYEQLRSDRPGASSAEMYEHVMRARRRQAERFADGPTTCNAQMTSRQVRAHCRLDAAGEAMLEQAMSGLGLSARAYAKILKVARTIADIADSPDIDGSHIAEAIQYRSLDRAVGR